MNSVPAIDLTWTPDTHPEVQHLVDQIDLPPDRRGVSTYRWLLEQLCALHPTNALLARLEGTPVGFALLTGDARAAVVHAVYTLPSYRGRGVGSALLTQCRAATAGSLHGIALPGDRATKNLFERAGMPAQLLVL